ncbi:MAG: SEC-C metal-binding domain-containing protein [Pseudomonadota bacterium]
MTDRTMHPDTPELPEAMKQASEAFVDASLQIILRDEDPDRYLRVIPDIAQHTGLAEWFSPQAPYWELGYSIWNATPLPSHGFRTAPLPTPQRNDTCPCGSGKKFKRCCQPRLTGYLMEPEDEQPIIRQAVALFTRKQCQAAANSAPAAVRIAVADRELQEGHPGKARAQLLNLLESTKPKSELQARAVYQLGEAYNSLGHRKAGKKTLLGLLPHLKAPAAATALQWLASHSLMDGRSDEALAHVLHAEHLEPDNLITAMLKVACLRDLGADTKARQTAEQWLPIAYETGDANAIELLEEQARLETLEDIEGGDWPDEASAEDEASDDNLLALFGPSKSTVKALTRLLQEAFQAPLLPVHFNQGPPDSDRNQPQWVLELPHEVQKAEATLYQDPDGADPLDPELIRRHPALLQSPDFLEQLDSHSGAPVIQEQADFHAALTQQKQRVIEHILAALPEGGQLPWGWIEHRPLLRVLMQEALDQPRPEDCIPGLQRVLALCPTDNLGVRAPLINALLHANHNEHALHLAEQYPDDHLAEPHYGRVLALVRLGRLHEAEQALQSAYQALPKVLNYLVADKRQRPKLDPYGMVIGGADQAWYYRQEMREVFASTPGMLAWLKRTKQRLRRSQR